MGRYAATAKQPRVTRTQYGSRRFLEESNSWPCNRQASILLTLSNEVLLKLLKELQVQQVILTESLFTNDCLHGLYVLPYGIVSILEEEEEEKEKMTKNYTIAREEGYNVVRKAESKTES